MPLRGEPAGQAARQLGVDQRKPGSPIERNAATYVVTDAAEKQSIHQQFQLWPVATGNLLKRPWERRLAAGIWGVRLAVGRIGRASRAVGWLRQCRQPVGDPKGRLQAGAPRSRPAQSASAIQIWNR